MQRRLLSIFDQSILLTQSHLSEDASCRPALISFLHTCCTCTRARLLGPDFLPLLGRHRVQRRRLHCWHLQVWRRYCGWVVLQHSSLLHNNHDQPHAMQAQSASSFALVLQSQHPNSYLCKQRCSCRCSTVMQRPRPVRHSVFFVCCIIVIS